MALLEDASSDDIKALVELFPVSSLKKHWHYLQGTKGVLTSAIGKEADSKKLKNFVLTEFSRCKQHTYAFQARDQQKDPAKFFPKSHLLGMAEKRAFYLATSTYTLTLRDPFRQEELTLLWPMRVEHLKEATLVSFVLLERDVKSFFGDDLIVARRHVEEKDIVSDVMRSGYKSCDLNKGTKLLWKESYMDAFRTKFKKARSTTTENMDRERGIRDTNPALYQEMQGLPMYETMFRTAVTSESAVKVFQVNPSHGILRMTRYTEGSGSSDELIRKILSKNV